MIIYRAGGSRWEIGGRYPKQSCKVNTRFILSFELSDAKLNNTTLTTINIRNRITMTAPALSF